MPTATVTGALLGWVVERRINKFRKPPSGPGSYAAMMVVGAWVANAVVELDNAANGRNPKKMKTEEKCVEI